MIEIIERRASPRHRVHDHAQVVLDEHSSTGCLIHDVSTTGVKITMVNPDAVPETFVLDCPSLGFKVCKIVWRDDGSIGAKFK